MSCQQKCVGGEVSHEFSPYYSNFGKYFDFVTKLILWVEQQSYEATQIS